MSDDKARARRKADQEWEMAGLARQDSDHKAEAEHTRRARLWDAGINPDSADAKHARRIAERFAEMAANFRTGGADIPKEWESAEFVARLVLASHMKREPLRLDLLAVARSSDVSHDVAAILRGDEFASARFALAYHPPGVLTAEALSKQTGVAI